MPVRSVTLRIGGDALGARRAYEEAKALGDAIDAQNPTLHIGADLPNDAIAGIQAKIEALTAQAHYISIAAELDPASIAKLAALNATLTKLSKQMEGRSVIGVRGYARTQAEIAAVASGLEALNAMHAEPEVSVKGNALSSILGLVGLGANKGPGLFGWASIPLFGGLGSVGAVHLLIDGILEVSAVLIPATAALIAFGIAGSDAAEAIYQHMSAIHTVLDATGINGGLYPATGALEKLHEAITPSVFSAFGDALTVIDQKTGVFSTLAHGAAQAVDYLAARATVAFTTGGGISAFMAKASSDLLGLGNFFGNLFGIIGNLLHSLPGIAETLLGILNGISHALEFITGSGIVQGIIKIGLAFHGWSIYAGIAATGVGYLIPLAARMVNAFAGTKGASTALKDLGTEASSIEQDAGKVGFFDKIKAGLKDITSNTPVVIGRLKGVGAAEEEAGAKAGVLARSSNVLKSAWAGIVGLGVKTWVTVAVAAFAAFILWANRGADSAETLDAHFQGLISNSNTLADVVRNTGNAIAVTKAHIDDTNKSVLVNTRAAAGGIAIYDELRNNVSKYSAEQHLAQQRVQELGDKVGGTNNALGLMAQLNIKAGDAATKSAHDWKIEAQEVVGLAKTYKAMHATGSTLSNDVEVLTNQTTDQYKAVQQLNQGWDTFTQNFTNTQQSFDTFALGIKTLDNSSTAVSHHLGDATLKVGGLGHAMDGLTKQDIALNQAFTTNVTNANAMVDTWRQAGLQGDVFTGAVKAMVARMLPFAKGSQEATDQLVGLAQEAGYKGPAAFSNLSTWAGTAHDALQKLKAAADQATQQEALLSTAMRNQGSLIANQLLSDLNQATLKYYGVQKAAIAYGNAVARDGQQSQAAHSARLTLIDDLVKSGQAAGDTTKQIGIMISKVLGIPAKRAIQIVEQGTGHFEISQGYGGTQTRSVIGTHRSAQGSGPSGAHGMFIHHGTTATADDVIARVSRGELIVPAHMVNSGLVDHLRGRIPGFAGGGLIDPLLSGNVGVLTGQAATQFNSNFIRQFTSSMESAMTKATKTAILAATALSSTGHPLSGAGRYSQGALERLWISAGGPPGLAHLMAAIADAESGGYPNAHNPSGASGLWQILGQIVPGNIFNPFINAENAVAKYRTQGLGAWVTYTSGAYQQYFDRGGWLMPGITMAINNTGRPERVIRPGGHGGDIYYISVKGDTNPDAAAMAIIQKIRDYKRHHGNQPTGIG